MSLDLYRLDSLTDYDEIIDALEDYVADLVEEFYATPECKNYLKAYPMMEEYVGSWIDNLLYFGYSYEEVTLPQMKLKHIELILTQLFPRKISLMNPDEADTTIPELIAFWQFLKRVYQLPQAHKIIKFLNKIQPEFKAMMNDSSNFGIAKSFFTQGMAAGFDMTSQEGLDAFQEAYNQNLPSAPPPALNLSEASIEAQLQQLLSSFEEFMSVPDVSETEEDRENDLLQLRTALLAEIMAEVPTLSTEEQELLEQQTISETEPGTLLKDFQMMLDFIGEAGTAVTGKSHYFTMKVLPELNERLQKPVQLDLKRPQQKSYPPIHGLYLLLRASGLAQITHRGKKSFLTLNPELCSQWQNFNPTERYCTLLEAWLIRSCDEMIGERGNPFPSGIQALQHWPRLASQPQTIKSYEEQSSIAYAPKHHNLALMNLFGLLQLKTIKPDPGKGYRIKQIKTLPFSQALMKRLIRFVMEKEFQFAGEKDPTLSLDELQPALQAYFPQWQQTLTPTQRPSQTGVYTFKVSFDKMWRRIAISSDQTLADLSATILTAIEFDSDHLDMFQYQDQMGRIVEVYHPFASGSPSTPNVKIQDLPLDEGGKMVYIFDFGDWWEFDVLLEKIDTDDSRQEYVKIIQSKGKAPEQYPDCDEEEWDGEGE